MALLLQLASKAKNLQTLSNITKFICDEALKAQRKEANDQHEDDTTFLRKILRPPPGSHAFA